jgi:putative protein-disulfide isomerase
VIVAGESGKAEEMLAAIQHAYYRDARNPSDTGTLSTLADDVGLDSAAFEAALQASGTQARLEEDFALRSTLGAYSFPSVGLRDGDEVQLLTTGWVDAATLVEAIEARLSGSN